MKPVLPTEGRSKIRRRRDDPVPSLPLRHLHANANATGLPGKPRGEVAHTTTNGRSFRPVDAWTPWASPPIGQEDKQIGEADGAIAVEIGRAVIAIGARAPVGQKDKQIRHTD